MSLQLAIDHNVIILDHDSKGSQSICLAASSRNSGLQVEIKSVPRAGDILVGIGYVFLYYSPTLNFTFFVSAYLAFASRAALMRTFVQVGIIFPQESIDPYLFSV